MINPQKIAAFTMVDVLTGMVISSIIISMVFYLFTALNKQVFGYGNTRNEINTYLLLKTDLKRQFEVNSNSIYGIPGGFSVKNDSMIINYTKEGELFMRSINLISDTITQHLAELNIQYVNDAKGQPTEYIKSCAVEIQLENQLLSPHFCSNSSLVDEINQQLIHEF